MQEVVSTPLIDRITMTNKAYNQNVQSLLHTRAELLLATGALIRLSTV